MKEPSKFEVPSPHEKLSFKFILDDLRHKEMEGVELHSSEPESFDLSPNEKQIEKCGALASPIEPELGHSLETIALPDGKKYFRIGEVADLLNVEPYILRYWESEFRSIRPTKTGAGHRVYGRKDLEALVQIRHLLYVEKFSLKGAKKKLLEKRSEVVASSPHVDVQKDLRFLKEIAGELKDLLHIVKTNPGSA